MAHQIYAAIGMAQGALSDRKGVAAGALVIGITSTAKYFAPRMIAEFARRYPGVDITLLVGNRLEPIAALRRLTVDVAITGRPPAQIDLVSEIFDDRPLIVIGPPDHPFVERRHIPKAEIANEPFLMREEGSGPRTVFEDFFDGQLSRRIQFGIESGSNQTIKQGVMAGLGLALISAHTVAFEVETARLAVLDVEGLPIMRKWFIARHADKAVLPALKAFWDFTLLEGQGYLPKWAGSDL
jgi:DNA-binding transcriptional LysR family regulator